MKNLAQPSYLSIRYAESERPKTAYPEQLCTYLSERFLSRVAGGTLLDLGSGRAEFLDAFARIGYRAAGVDRELPSDAGQHPPIVCCDIERESLPFEDSSFDVVFNKSVLEHTREISHVLAECHRVLTPGGFLVSLVPDFKAQWSHFYDDWTHVRPFTLVGLSQCLLGHHFELLSAERFRQLPLLWRQPYLRPLADLCVPLPAWTKRLKWVRFSQEWMLLAVARKPDGRRSGESRSKQ